MLTIGGGIAIEQVLPIGEKYTMIVRQLQRYLLVSIKTRKNRLQSVFAYKTANFSVDSF